MYSPKIREDLIPRIYRAAKEEKLPMTAWINRALEQSLSQIASKQEQTESQRKVRDERNSN